jgi:hypothetical protein
VLSPAEMANIVRSYAFQIGANEARLALCRNQLWARLMRDGHPTDMLFALSGEGGTSGDTAQSYYWA